MRPLYIISSCAISPQHTFDEAEFLKPVETTEDGKLFAIDTDYTEYISPVAIRRMSKMLKRGITAGMRCLARAGVSTPDAIIIGTGRGSVTDMENFLKDMIRLDEQTLNPTGFIQSTYNSVNGWLAMMTKCTEYNQTYVHRDFSFELALFDAQLLLSESAEKKYILAGCFDELTDEYYSIRGKIDYFKNAPPLSTGLFSHYDTPGSIAGEGAYFFTVSNDPSNASCAIQSVTMSQKPGVEDLSAAIGDTLSQNGLRNEDIDMVVCGMNGDGRSRFLIDALISQFTEKTTVIAFKHLSGEYDTAVGFGIWLADYICRNETAPGQVIYKGHPAKAPKNILLCNVTIVGNASIMLITR